MNLRKHDEDLLSCQRTRCDNVRPTWAGERNLLFYLLHVFHTILKSNMPAEHRAACEMEMTTWKEKYLTRLAEEALMRSEQNQSRQVAHG